MDGKQTVISAKNLSKTFSNESVQQHVLKNLNLSIYKGDFTVIMGNSGSGKSTLLYALSGMDRPSIGTVTYYVNEGRKDTLTEIEISQYNNDRLAKFRRDHVGFVFQQNYLNDSMSALDNILVCGLLKSTDKRKLTQRAKELLEKVEITERDYRKFPTQLSGGQQQRVAVVRGVINAPEVLFADEPTGALDSYNSDQTMKCFKQINKEKNQTIVMVTHSAKAAAASQRIMIIKDGKIGNNIYSAGKSFEEIESEINASLR